METEHQPYTLEQLSDGEAIWQGYKALRRIGNGDLGGGGIIAGMAADMVYSAICHGALRTPTAHPAFKYALERNKEVREHEALHEAAREREQSAPPSLKVKQ